jgi:hypothetical protein
MPQAGGPPGGPGGKPQQEGKGLEKHPVDKILEPVGLAQSAQNLAGQLPWAQALSSDQDLTQVTQAVGDPEREVRDLRAFIRPEERPPVDQPAAAPLVGE